MSKRKLSKNTKDLSYNGVGGRIRTDTEKRVGYSHLSSPMLSPYMCLNDEYREKFLSFLSE